MSAGSQENFPPAAGGAATAKLPQAVVTQREREPRRPLTLMWKGFFVAILAFVSVLSLYPFLWLLSASLKPQEDIYDNRLIPREFQWNFWGDPSPAPGDEGLFDLPQIPVLHWLWNSVWISVLGALLVVFSSALVAFAFAYFRFPLRNFLFGVVLATMMLPGAVTMIPVYLIWNDLGKFTDSHAWLPHVGVNTQYPLWLPNLFGSAFYIFLQRQFFLSIPREYFEAARMDGDSYFSMFRRIALPLAKPALIVTFIFEFQTKWFDFMTPLIYLRDSDLFTMPLGLKTIVDSFATGGGTGRWEIIVAGTVVTVLPMLLIFAIFQRYFIEGIATQGRKG